MWANETDEERKLSTSLVKWLVGGDTITARPLYGKEDITFRPTHTLFLLTNHKPQVDANDYALWKRLHLIPFTQSFVDRPSEPHEHLRDPDLIFRFTHIEAMGILAWAVKGCLSWQEHGLYLPETIKDTTREYAEEEDSLTPFLMDMREKHGMGWIKALTLYQCYLERTSVCWGRPTTISPPLGATWGKGSQEENTKEEMIFSLGKV